ncbi:MAG: pectate lyase [Candidatus Latescibacteria bacterium]|nr:pectate lyase [Candidatus Latescibacterota bacterium]
MSKVKRYSYRICFIMVCLLMVFSVTPLFAQKQNKKLTEQALATMEKATRYMVDTVSTNGGYLWHYLPDLSRRWGEMEAYDTMIWVQPPGTTSMGHLFLDAYHVTGDPSYFKAADKAAAAIIWGQLDCGGWNYIVDFAGDRSLKEWYNTIGKNGWRLEEFQHYYGNATFDDDVSSDAAKFLLRMYLENLDPKYKYPLDKAIEFVMESQYPVGGWPQRYPLRYDFSHHGNPDYTSYYTFNDDVVWENVNFLIQCYLTLGEQRFLDPIYRGMNFYISTQIGPPQAGWAQQYTLDLKPAGARTYEPNGLLPGYTCASISLLMRFYRYTGETKFLAGIPAAFDWLESCRLPQHMTDNGKYTHPTFVELGTNKPIFVHRKGSNVVHGYYYVDYDDKNLLIHYGGKSNLNNSIKSLRAEYEKVSNMSVEEATKDSPLFVKRFTEDIMPQKYYDVKSQGMTASAMSYGKRNVPTETQVQEVINSVDDEGRWLVKHVPISNPYIGDGTKTEPTDKYASTDVGDETDTSCYTDETDQLYISTREYINKMTVLMNYVASQKELEK